MKIMKILKNVSRHKQTTLDIIDFKLIKLDSLTKVNSVVTLLEFL